MKKRVLLFVSSNKGTIAIVSYNLYLALLKHPDVELKVVLLVKLSDGTVDFGDVEFLETEKTKLNPFIQFIKRVFWFKRIKKHFLPDLTINTLFICSILNVLSGGKDKKLGVFHSPHSQSAVNGKLNLFISGMAYKYIYPRLDKLVCVSEEIRDSIITDFKFIDSKKVEVIYNIHDVENIKSKSIEDIDEQFVDLFRKPVILYCGRFDSNKAPDRLLRAFVVAQHKLPEDVQLVYIGKNQDGIMEKMIEIALEHIISDKLHFLGFQANPYKYIAKSTMLVSCSYSEGLPGVLIESLILRTPVISTNSSKGVWEILSVEEHYDKMLTSNFETKIEIVTLHNTH